MAKCKPKIKTDFDLVKLVLWGSLALTSTLIGAERNHSQKGVGEDRLEDATDQEAVPVSWKRGFRAVSNHTVDLKSLPTTRKANHFRVRNASLNESIHSGELKTEDGLFEACEMCLDWDRQGQCLTMSKGSSQQVCSLSQNVGIN